MRCVVLLNNGVVMIKNILIFVAITLYSFSFLFSADWKNIAEEQGLSQKAYHIMVMSGGVAWLDYDNDGWEDFYVTGGDSTDKLFRNLGDGTFKEVTKGTGLEQTKAVNTNGALAFDYDNDGWTDLLITTGDNMPNLLFKNLGNGKFQERGIEAGLSHRSYSYSASAGDINNDGFLDIYILNYASTLYIPCLPNYLYISDGNGGFVEQAEFYGVDNPGCGLGVAFSDYDNDGDVDIILANDFGMQSFQSPNKLFRNNFPEASFSDVSEETGFELKINGMGVGVGDYNEDGYLDYYITNIDSNLLMVYNPTTKKYAQKSFEAGVQNRFVDESPDKLTDAAVSWGTAFVDYDNDSWEDLFVTNGFVFGHITFDPDRLYKNNADGTFTDVTFSSGFGKKTFERGLAYCDFDKDGDIDIAVAVVVPFKTDTLDYNLALWRNELQDKKSWFQLRLIGSMTNRDAFGSRVTLYANGRKMIREKDGGSSHLSTHSAFMHWGLGDISKIDSVVIQWYGQKSQTLIDVPINSRMTVLQKYEFENNVTICAGQSFQNIEISNDTTITMQYVAKNGADSIVVTNIKVNPLSESILNESVCVGETYRDWTIISDSVYIETRTNYLGCDSIIVHNITMMLPVEHSADTSICYAGEYNGRRYTRAAVVPQNFTGYNGCDSVFTMNVNIIESPKTEAQVEICYGDEYDGKQYFESTDLIETYSTIEGCDSVNAVLIIVHPEFNEEKFVSIMDYEEWNGLQLLKDTVITESLKSINGCDSTIVWNISVVNSVENGYENHFRLSVSPNPINTATTISWELNTPKFIEIRLYSIDGIDLGVIHSGIYDEGSHNITWNIWNDNKVNLPNGVYLVSMKTDMITQSVKIIILK